MHPKGRRAIAIAIVLVSWAVAISGCTSDDGVTTYTTEFEFQSCSLSKWSGGDDPVYAISGCPQDLLHTDTSTQTTLEIPVNTTGLMFTFNVSMVEPWMEAHIRAYTGPEVYLEQTLAFAGGRAVLDDTGSLLLDHGTYRTDRVASLCEATHLHIDWGPEPVHQAALSVTAFVAGDYDGAREVGSASCNGYWGAY